MKDQNIVEAFGRFDTTDLRNPRHLAGRPACQHHCESRVFGPLQVEAGEFAVAGGQHGGDKIGLEPGHED
jgi:hypothetical protein